MKNKQKLLDDIVKQENANNYIFEMIERSFKDGLIEQAYEYWKELDPPPFDYECWWDTYLIGWELFTLGIDCLETAELCFKSVLDLAPDDDIKVKYIIAHGELWSTYKEEHPHYEEDY